MKKILILLFVILLSSMRSVTACSPPSTDFIEIHVKDCTDNNYNTIEQTHNVDVMVKIDGLFDSETVTENARIKYRNLYPDYESFAYLETTEYVSYSAYISSSSFSNTDCFVQFGPDDSVRGVAELSFDLFYVVVFNDNGEELFRSEETQGALFNNDMSYFSLNYETESLTIEQLEFDGCAGAYGFVFGVLGGIALVLSVLGFAAYGIVTGISLLILKNAMKIKSTRIVATVLLSKILFVLLFFGYAILYQEYPRYYVTVPLLLVLGALEYVIVNKTEENKKALIIYIVVISIAHALLFAR